MLSRWKSSSVAAVACLALALTAGCAKTEKSTPSADPATSASSEPATAVAMEFWGWAPGYKEVTELWNSSHPQAQVKYIDTPSTIDVYPKMFTAIKAGNGPCLGQAGYEALPNFVIQRGAMDISQYTAGYEKDFTPGGWKSVSIADGVYGIPVDTAPMAMIYRKDLFEKYGLTVPKTWPEYKEMAAKVKAADPSVSLGYFSNNANFIAGLARQAGAKWFELGKNSWKINLNDAKTKQVSAFWQSMIDEGLIVAMDSFKPALYKQMAEGKILSETFGIWDTAVIAQNVPDLAGKWGVAPMPVWPDAPDTYSEMGGSATVILEGCKYPKEAVEFAHWMSTDPEAAKILISKGGLWPASVAGLSSPVLDEPVAYFGSEKIYEPFKAISKNMKFDWTWGPLQNVVNTDLEDSLGKATKENTIDSIMQKIQDKAVADAKTRGMTVE